MTDLERFHLESLMRSPVLLLIPIEGLNAETVKRGWASISQTSLGEVLSITPAGRAALSEGEPDA